MLNILLAGNYPILITGIRSILETEYGNVSITEAYTYDSIAAQFGKGCYDLAILVFYPLPTSLQGNILKWKIPSYTPSLLLGPSGDLEYVKYIYRSGFKGYLQLLTDKAELLAAIRELLVGDIYVPKKLGNNLLGVVYKSNLLGNGPIELTWRERQITDMMVTGRSNMEIGVALGLKPSTISTFKKRIFIKMKVENIAELVSSFHSNNLGL